MKEIIAVIRPRTVTATKNALVELGFPALNALPVLGRGKQCGIAEEIGYPVPAETVSAATTVMKYVPKRLISLVVPDEAVEAVVAALIATNATDRIGDGRIFICPVTEAVRVRTGETGNDALT